MCFKKNPSDCLKERSWWDHSWRQETRRLFYKLSGDNEVVCGKRTDPRIIPRFENENYVWVSFHNPGLLDISATSEGSFSQSTQKPLKKSGGG